MCVHLSLQFMTATEDVADEVASKLAGMDPKARAAAKAKAKVGGWGVVWPVWGSIGCWCGSSNLRRFCLKEQAAGVLMTASLPLRQVDQRPSGAAAVVVLHPLTSQLGWCVVLCRVVLCCPHRLTWLRACG